MWTKPTTSTSDPFAPPPASGPLFPASLISPAVSSALPQKYSIRPLQRSDFKAGHLDPLRVLTQVGEISQQEWVRQYDWMARVPDTYYLLVICDGDGKIVGTGTLMKERKFIHKLGSVGHIEDIAVLEDQQGRKLGLHILHALSYIAQKVGCYKQILDCSAKNEGFYVKCGFKRVGLEMAQYNDTSPAASAASKV